jgi:hypothetical protein
MPSKQHTIGWKRVFHEVYCWLSLLAIFPSYYYGGIPLFVLQTILGGGVACLLDWFISSTMSNNVKRIIERGYASSQWEVLIQMYLTILTSESIALGLAIYFGCLEPTTIAAARLDITLISRVLISLAFNEMIFTTAHTYLLHGTALGGRVHVMHHCCQPSSFSTSFIFHFGDSNTEFTLTTVLMAVAHNFVFQHPNKDPFSLLVSLQVVYLWYTVADHSENLRLPHYFHHHYVTDNYTAYFSTNVTTKYIGLLLSRDFVKEELQRSKQKYAAADSS